MTTTNTWKVNADGDWATATDWSQGRVPNSADVVTISTANVHAITHNSGADVIDKLTVGKDFFTMGGGSLDILTTASFADGYTQTGGSLTVGAISVTGPLGLFGGSSEGATAFTVTGTTTLSGYTLGGASSLTVSSTANETGQITLGDSSGVGAAINVGAAGAYDIAGDFGIGVGQGAASATLTNGGTLAKTAGSGASTIGVSVNSTGTISAASGNLDFSGPTNVISGKLTGAGQISFGGGVTTLSATSITVGTLGIYGTATVDLKVNPTFSGTFVDSSNGTTTLNLGTHTLTLAGASSSFAGNFGPAVITGSGTLANKSTLTLSNVVVGGTVKISNAKTIDQTGQVTLGDGSGGATSITNLSTGVYDFTSDTGIGVNDTAGDFLNQGILEKTASSTGQSLISLALTNSGTIHVQAGDVAINGTLVNTGTINGSGALEVVNSGSVTLNKGTVLSVTHFDLFNTSTLTLGASLSYGFAFDDSSNGSNQINLGANTLTLTGKLNTLDGGFGVTDIAGSGKIAITGAATVGGAVIDGTVELSNAGTINQNGTITIGGGAGQVASLVNAKGATFNVAGAFGIGDGTAAASHFDNSGTVSVAAGGTGTATFATNFNNLAGGVLTIASGALDNVGVLNNSGTISGTQLVLGASGQTNLNTGTVLSVSQVDINNNAVLNLGASLTYSGEFSDDSNGSTTLNLGSSTLTLSGQTDFAGSFGAAIVTGTGTLKLTHATTMEGTTDVGGTATFDLTSKAIVTGSLQVGDGSANAAKAVVAATGIYDLTADGGISGGSSAASTFTNNGLFEKTAGIGTSVVSVDFINNGTITVTSGTLEFIKGTLSGSGTINGTISHDTNGDELITAAAPSKAAAPALAPNSQTSVHLLAQAAASLGADRGFAATSGQAGTARNDALLAVVGDAHLSPRRFA